MHFSEHDVKRDCWRLAYSILNRLYNDLDKNDANYSRIEPCVAHFVIACGCDKRIYQYCEPLQEINVIGMKRRLIKFSYSNMQQWHPNTYIVYKLALSCIYYYDAIQVVSVRGLGDNFFEGKKHRETKCVKDTYGVIQCLNTKIVTDMIPWLLAAKYERRTYTKFHYMILEQMRGILANKHKYVLLTGFSYGGAIINHIAMNPEQFPNNRVRYVGFAAANIPEHTHDKINNYVDPTDELFTTGMMKYRSNLLPCAGTPESKQRVTYIKTGHCDHTNYGVHNSYSGRINALTSSAVAIWKLDLIKRAMYVYCMQQIPTGEAPIMPPIIPPSELPTNEQHASEGAELAAVNLGL